MFRLVVGLSVLVFGAAISLYGLIRLGFLRHGQPWHDVSYLSNEPTTAHVENLASLGGGVICMVVGVWLVVAAVRRLCTGRPDRSPNT
jgi:hypothetical protein